MDIKLNFEEYCDKVYACWMGKNIGGTMGTPYEGTREYLDVKGFVTREGEVLANDDLDLQLVWLDAVEKYGLSRVNAKTLGEFWLNFIGPHWNEYGIGKANMKMGLLPPLSGDYRNSWKNSNGAWIRTEIWACLNPGRPDVAAKYAIEDACIDHGTGEGTYAAIFVAAMQSAAFALKDLRECIDVALSKIPEDSRMAKSVRLTIDCYNKGLSPREARDTIQKSNADIGDGWFEAPSNVSYAVLGLLYGEGDFKKSMIAAINCGDDTDCTAATLGATFGILYGTKGLPADWVSHIGDDIVTVSIDKGTLSGIPKNCTELTARVVEQAKLAIVGEYSYPFWFGSCGKVSFTDGAEEIPAGLAEHYCACTFVKEYLEELLPNSFTETCDIFHVTVALENGADIAPGEEKKLRLIVRSNSGIQHLPFRLQVRWWLPEGFAIQGRRSVYLPCCQPVSRPENVAIAEEYVLTAGETVGARNRVVAEITADGHVQSVYLPVMLIG